MSLIQHDFENCKGVTRQRLSDPDLITFNFLSGGASIPFDDFGWQYILDRIEDGYVATRAGRELILCWFPGSEITMGGEA